jgi:hypothetical protein
VKRLLLTTLGVGGTLVAGWEAFVRFQGDAEMAYEGSTLSHLTVHDRIAHGEIAIANRGKQGGVIHRFEGRIVDGPPGRVLVTRKGSKPPERGWWVSNCLKPGESCVAEVDVELEQTPTRPVVIEIDAHEVGRRLKVHRTLRLSLPAPVPLVSPEPEPAA